MSSQYGPKTLISCTRCGKEAERNWKEGDQVNKKLDYPCPYCQDEGIEENSLVITNIYGMRMYI